MTDLSQMNLILGPANQAMSQNLRFLRDFRQNMGQGGAPPQGNPAAPQQPYPPPAGSPGAMPADQALYMQNMMGQMHQMLSMMTQMGSILQKLQTSGVKFKDAGLTDEQVNFIRDFIATMAPAPPQPSGAVTGRNAAISYLGQFLKKEGHEQNATDQDNDGNVVDTGDLEQIKAALDEGTFTKTDLQKGFQYLLVKTDNASVDELLGLFRMAEKEGLVSVKGVFSPGLMDKLPADRTAQAASFLAEEGLALENGDPNTGLINFLQSGLNADAPEKVNAFAKTLVKTMVSQWLKPPAPDPSPEKDQLVYFLRLNGFKFKTDGSLEPDSQQPFPVGILDQA